MFLPEGSQDEIGAIIANRSKVFETFRHVAALRNYTEISTPLVEYADTFTNVQVGMKLQNMLKWFNAGGQIEVLRPDWTTSIARALAKKEFQQHKWAYQGSIFRQETPGLESRQVGIEIVDLPALLGESECLFFAHDFFAQLGIQDVMVELGHTGIFEEWVAELGLPADQVDRLRAAMHDKRKDEVYGIASSGGNGEIAAELAALVDAYGPFSMIQTYLDRWKGRPAHIRMLEHIQKLGETLFAIGIKDIIIDLGRVKNLPYYTGILFRGFLKQNGAACFSGGCYDKLYDQFNRKTTAVGIAFNADILAEQLGNEKTPEKICIIATEETLAEAEKLRKKYTGSIVDVRFEKPVRGEFDTVLQLTNNSGKWGAEEV
ncbi:ATP phosphoribosyltransferase regulatory subunit [Heyndrickxia acidiproducens]|uniref:ATP phosphoribosyltransferase regulatory subunit n=1 Tax=Heyndrickxia acidiproducens TaxID=1121084 RepID=UPI00035F8F33|nr:ATP phosphoribosyltransferase regulatory subunit [Heyndrickxia acidiproducens]